MYITIEAYEGRKQNVRLVNTLKRCRFDKGDLSQQALAAEVGVTRQTIIAIERGRFVPSTLLALKLARFLGKPVEEIFRLEESSPPAPDESGGR